MRIERTVCREKFAREVETLARQHATLRLWGCWVQRTEFPIIDAVFLPRAPLRLLAQIAQPSGLIIQPKPMFALTRVDFPGLAAKAFGVRVSLDDFDVRAPSLSFCDPWTWGHLTAGEVPFGHHPDTGMRVVIETHPETQRPFLCMRGTREYHEHPQHSGDDWMLHRGDRGVFDLLSTVWSTCVQHALPVINPLAAASRWLSWAAKTGGA